MIGPLAILALLLIPEAVDGSMCGHTHRILPRLVLSGLPISAVLAAFGVALTAAGARDRPTGALLAHALTAGAALPAAAMLLAHLPEALGERHEGPGEILLDALGAGAVAGVAGALTALLALLIARRVASCATH